MFAVPLLVFVTNDASYGTGTYGAAAMAAVAIAGLMFAMAKGPAMANQEGEQSFKAKGFGVEVEAKGSGKSLFSVNNCLVVILILQVAQIVLLVQHLYESGEQMRGVAYVLSLSPEDKAKLNFVMPESIRKMMRHREP